MQITRECDYAMRCVEYLASSAGKPCLAREIADKKAIPKTFLLKILQKLTRAGIVRSYRGVKGGFALEKRPRDITLLDVIEIIDGPLMMSQCVIQGQICQHRNSCSIHPVWMDLRKLMEKRLRKENFAKLALSTR